MTKIPEHILNEIQDRCDIVEVISSYIPLKGAGRNFKALCPFHHEKTPSFVVSPDKQIYHCFGCNSGGNVFNFIKEYEKIDFIDVVKMLAKKTGVKLPERKSAKEEDSSLVTSLYTAVDIAANFYFTSLESAYPASVIRAYLDKRGLEDYIVKRFRLGYAGVSSNSLLDYLSKRGIKTDIALKAGLVIRTKDGSLGDLFRNRLIFPISDSRGRVVAFGARILGDGLPKYINSPETPIYKKSRHLYGLNFAKTSIREKGFAIITEGYLDVITSHQYGIQNAVSSLGTALTVEQIRLLKRFTHNVVTLYDADQAGEIATLRGLDLFLEEGMSVKVATLDKGHDPDSFLHKFGPRGFDVVIKKAKSLFSYKLDILTEKFTRDDPEEKASIVKEMLNTINKVRNAVIKAEYIRMLSHELSIKEEAIWEELKKIKKDSKTYEPRTTNHERRTTINISPAEKILVKLMLEDAKVVDIVKNELEPFDFKNPEVRNLVEFLFRLSAGEGSIDITKLINRLDGIVEASLVSFIVNDEVQIRNRDKNIQDCIKTIKRETRDQRLNDIQNRLNIAKEKGYESEEKRLIEEFNNLIKRRI